MKTYVIVLLLFLPLHLFAGIMQINRCNVGSNSNDAATIATIDVSIEDILENELSVCIDNEIYTLPLLYTENRGDNDFGVIFQNDSIMVSISVYKNQLSGMIQKNGFHYSIERDSTGNLYLSEIDMCSASDLNEILEEPIYNSRETNQVYDTQDTIVRVAVFYVHNINNSFKYNIVSNVNQAILHSNASFVNSNIHAKLELVYIGGTSYMSEQDMSVDLSRFRNPDDGYMDEVHRIRESYSADVCVLLTLSPSYCGLSPRKVKSEGAFCAVRATSDCFNQFSFVHEIGHLVGCHHDPYVVSEYVDPPYAYGYVHLDGQNSWRTIMAYYNLCSDNGCSCPRILHWSNPNITYNGIATGDELSNNARVWNEHVNTVSNFFHFPSALLLTDTLLNSANYAYARVIDSISTTGECIIDNGSEVTMQATEQVVLKPGFHAKAGSEVHIAVTDVPCNLTEDATASKLAAKSFNQLDNTWCNQWNILSHGQESDPDEPFPHARTNIYWLSENTINRNGHEYIPLMCSSSKPNVESTHLVGELRFTEDKQVYFYYDNTEYLLYDFGAQVGDQLQIFSGINNYNHHDYYKTYTHVVTRREYLDDGRIKLTSIPFFDGPVPDDINENNYLSVTWIEGVGSEHGIVHNNINNLPGMGTEWLLCAYRDDECRYTTDDPEYAPLGCVYNEGDVINAVESVSISAPSVQKIIKDGQLLILRDGQTYNVMGMEVK